MKNEISYISISEGSPNIGDDFIEQKFLEEFKEFNLKKVGKAVDLKNLKINNKTLSVMSNSIPRFATPIMNNSSYDFKHLHTNKQILPISAGLACDKKEFLAFDYKIWYKTPMLLFFPLIIFAFLVNIILFLLQSERLSKKRLYRNIDIYSPISARTLNAKKYFESIGYKNVFFTGCITTWGLKSNYKNIKKDNVVISFTNENLETRKFVVKEAKKHYNKVYIWIQSDNEKKYIDKFNNVIFKDFDEYSKVLKNADYIGSRLHAGIFALWNNSRAYFVAVDHRVRDYSKYLGIKYFEKDEWTIKINEIINEDWFENYVGPKEEEIKAYRDSLKEALWK